MTTLSEIKHVVAALPREQKHVLYHFLQLQLRGSAAEHGVLDIAPVHLGPVLRPLDDDEDLLAEMLCWRGKRDWGCSQSEWQ
jgi:hypothetical protein